jgi:hypothetical protein
VVELPVVPEVVPELLPLIPEFFPLEELAEPLFELWLVFPDVDEPLVAEFVVVFSALSDLPFLDWLESDD